MNEKLTSLAQLRMTAEKSKELSAQVASAMAEAVEELDASKAAVEHTHTAEQVGALSTSGGTMKGSVTFVGSKGVEFKIGTGETYSIKSTPGGTLYIGCKKINLNTSARTVSVDNIVETTRTINDKPLNENVILTASDVGALPADETNKPYEFISSSGTKCTIYGGAVKFSSHDENSITLKANNSGLDYPMIEIYATISGKEYRVGFLGCYGEGTGHLFLGSQYSDSGLVVTRRYVDDAIAAALATVETALAGV